MRSLLCCVFFIFQGGAGERFLIGSDLQLLLTDTVTNRTDSWDVEEGWTAHSMAYHYSKGLLFYAINNGRQAQIQTSLKRISVPFNGRENPINIETKGLIHEVAIDWIEDRIYLLNSDDLALQVSDLDGNSRSTIITRQKLNEANKTVIIQPPLRKNARCRNLVIDPLERVLFMIIDEINETNKRRSRSFLMTSDLNGNASTLQFVEISPLIVMEINVQQRILYMYRIRDNLLLTFNYNHSDDDEAAEVYNSHIYYDFSGEFTVFGSHLYWFDHLNSIGDIYKINLFKGVKSQELYFHAHVQQQLEVFEFLAFEPQVQSREIDMTPQKCNIDGCSHECRMVGLASCTCPACYMLGDDYMTCQDKVDPFLASSLTTCQKYKGENNTFTFILGGENGETPALTNQGLEAQKSGSCPVELHPSRLINWLPCRRGQTCTLSVWSKMDHLSLVEINCSPGLRFVSGGTKAFSICQDGTWDPPILHCFKLCSPLKSQTLELQCWRGEEVVNCNQLHLPNTTATYQCKEYHEASYASQPSGVRCTDDGTWTRDLPRCTPKCGLSNLVSLPGKPGGSKLSKPGNFPWHAAIYHNKSSQWEAVCGGTLVSSKVILTAAHCVTISCQNCKPVTMANEDIIIALGKFHNDFYVLETSETKKSVKEIRVHPNYVGSALNFIADIAVVILEQDVEINSYIMPACVDYLKTNYYRVTPNTEGYISGWFGEKSVDQSCDITSTLLKYSKTGIMNFKSCNKLIQSIKGQPVSRVTPDKFCSSNASESVVQSGDSGGGLTLYFDGVYYVYGIVSATLKLKIDNQADYTFAVFTSIPKYLDWLSSSLY